MSDAIWVATRKGLFQLARHPSGWEVERVSFLGDPVSQVLDDRRDGTIYAALSLGHFGAKLRRSRDRGRTWEEVAAPAFPEGPERRHDPNVQDVHHLAMSPVAPEVVWAQHHNGVFRSTDGSASWQGVTGIRPSVFGFAVAVHPTDPDTAWFVPAVKDECRIPVDGRVVVARTRDGGKTSEVLRNGLPQEHAYDITFRHALDVGGRGQSLAFGTTTGSLWVSDDQGDSWQCVSNHLPPVYAVRFVK